MRSERALRPGAVNRGRHRDGERRCQQGTRRPIAKRGSTVERRARRPHSIPVDCDGQPSRHAPAPVCAADRAGRRATDVGAVVTLSSFGHVLSMTDSIGMFEHADHAQPRREHGYCTDDVARLLIVAVREPDRSEAVRELARTAYRFLSESQNTTGRTRNRRDADGRWRGSVRRRGLLGSQPVGVRHSGSPRAGGVDAVGGRVVLHDHGVAQRSPHRRAMAFAAPHLVLPKFSKTIVVIFAPAPSSPTRSRRSEGCRRSPIGRGPNPDCRTPTRRCPRRSSRPATSWIVPTCSTTV